MSPMPWVFPSVSIWPLLCMRLRCLFPSDVSVVSVSLASASASLVLTCSAESCGIWHPLKSPPLLPHARTNTSTISQDKLGFCDFLQIPPQISENNLKALHRQRHEYKRASVEAYGKELHILEPELPGSCLST